MKKLKKDKIQTHSYKSKFALLGSCFSENIHTSLIHSGFTSISNPYGVLFSPKAIEQFILNSNNILFENSSFISRENIFLNYHANSKVYGLDRKAYENKLKALRLDFLENLKTVNTLFITLGTAWVYTEKKNAKIVANCHKIKQANFTKKMLTVSEIVEGQLKVIRFLKEKNPDLNIVYTVSPIRHTKDGLVENNRSKARLFESIGILEEKSAITYFPSYEYVIDELRDYRFFEEDGIHPNQLAIEAVANFFFEQYFTQETLSLRTQYSKLKAELSHIPIHPELISAQANRKRVEEAFEQFKKRNGIK